MSLTNMARTVLSKVPGANHAIDGICASFNELFGAQHNIDTGAHTTVTAISLSVPPSTSDGSGTVGSSLLPSANGTYDLGGHGTAPTIPFFAWRTLFLTGGIEWAGGDVSAASQHISAYSDTLSGSNRITQGNVSGQTHAIKNDIGTTLRIDNASVTVGPAAGRGTLIGTLEITGNIAADNGLYERTRTVRMGEWTTFTPTQTADVGTWTGSTITTAQYMLIGKTMFVQFAISAGNNSGAASELRIDIPGGFVSNKFFQMPIRAVDLNVNVFDVSAYGTASGTRIGFIKESNWAVNAANGNYVRGLIFFEVQ